MKTFLLLTVLFITLPEKGYSQADKKETYAIINIEGLYDKPNKRYWCKINAEYTGKYSKEISSLVTYSLEKGITNTGASFYFEKKDTSTVYFNYFLNTAEAMQFLADHQWKLVSVNNQVSSDYENVRDGESKLVPITKVSSRPVYYFKKEVQ